MLTHNDHFITIALVATVTVVAGGGSWRKVGQHARGRVGNDDVILLLVENVIFMFLWCRNHDGVARAGGKGVKQQDSHS